MAVLGLPLAFALTSLGIGLLVERVLQARLPNALLIPLGACGSIVASLAVYWTGLGDAPAVVIMLALTVAGAIFARDGLRSRLNLGWPGLAGLSAYLLFLAPELLAGHWTWSGYNFLNDTATQWVLMAYMKAHGTVAVGLTPPRSTTTEFVRVYLATAYPLGAQAHLATLSGLLDTSPPVLYQGYLAALAGTTAMALATLSDRCLSPRVAALAGFVAASAALTYQYALQGNIKELGTLTTCAAALAIIRNVATERIDLRGALLVSVPLAALLDTFYSAAIPFAGAVGLVGVAVTFLTRGGVRDLQKIGAPFLSLVTTLVLAAPASASIVKSYNIVSSTFSSSGGPGSAPSLGQLLRPLPLSQVSGIWLSGDYRVPITAVPAGKLTALLTVLVFVLAPVGAVLALRAREIGPAALLVAMGLVLAVVVPRVTPYAAAKTLAIASPAVVLAAFVGAAVLGGVAKRRTGVWPKIVSALSVTAGACLAIGVVASDGLAYHHDNVAPTPRMLAIEQVGDHFAGRGPILWNEFEEYAKYFAAKARINVPTEALTPRQAQLLAPESIYAQYFDLDQEQLSYVESFPIIVIRRSPSASRPPANYRLDYTNSYYQAWVQQRRPVVLRHLGLQLVYSASEPVGCTALRVLVAGAPRNSELVAAVYPFVSGFDPRTADHSPGWPVDPIRPEALAMVSPGMLRSTVKAVRRDLYEIWVEGSFPRAVTVEVDGRKIGEVQGVNTVNEWFSVGVHELARGPHLIRLERGGGDFAPGDGGPAYVGPVAIVESMPERLVPLPTARWRSLCGRTLDWVELVEP